MKVFVLSSVILILGLSSQLPAIERPKALDDQPDAQEQPPERAQVVEGEVEAIPQVNQGAYLGVLSETADETLGIHLGFEKGVVLQYVAKESPANAAGLRKHDIITKVDGRPVANQEELRNEILAHQAGDEVSLEVFSQGARAERKVVLGERPADLPRVPQAPQLDGNLPDFGARFPDLEDRMKQLEGILPNGGDDLQERLQEQMQKLEKQLKDLEVGGGLKLDLDLDEMLQAMPKPGKGFNFNFKSTSSFKFVDEEGSVEMKMNEGNKEVAVRDAEGELLFEGPWETPQDKAAAPEEIRQRIEKVNEGNRFHFRLDNVPKPKMELPDAKDEELE